MRILYMGTPDFSVLPLKNLIENGFNVVGVVTNKDKPFGRKQVLTPCAVKTFAIDNGIPVFSYNKIRIEGVEDVKKINPDIIITCAFGQILSQEIIDIPRLGVVNIHASLLPKYRGASPIHFAILNGEENTGITIMKTDVGIDTGDIIMQKVLKIGENETCGELFERLSILGAECIVEAVKSIQNGTATFTKQDDSIATHTSIIRKEMAKIDWAESNKNVFNKVRAFNPSPVAFTGYNGEVFKIYSVTLSNGIGDAGEILSTDGCIEVACGIGSVKIEKLQRAGGKPLLVADFLRGFKISKGGFFA